MRRIAWALLLIFAFAIPWEYSLDLGEPLGNVVRIAGLLVLLAAVPALLHAGRLRTPGAMQWMVLALYLWFCLTCFWTLEPAVTLIRMRGFFQEMMLVWLVWEFAESPEDLRSLMRAYVAGAWVLVLLTLANVGSAEAIAAEQVRFVAQGQDPNDAARYLDLGLPLAALLLTCERHLAARLLAIGYLPLGLMAVVVTASRGGFLAAAIALAGCAWLLGRSLPRLALAGAAALPLLAAALWFSVPRATLERLATIPAQLQSGDLNQRWNIWSAGWAAFQRAPLAGSGAGSFVSAAGMNPLDTAHNTELSILVGGGLIALSRAVAILVLAVRAALSLRGPLRLALGTVLLVLLVAAQVDTVEENRTTWLLLGIMALAGRLAADEPERLAECFAAKSTAADPAALAGLHSSPAG
jgi:putative inorganic carbon (HCO3(-)) transporter